MSPAMALLLSMTVVPTLYLVYYAFRHEDLLGPNSHWVGFDNFQRVLTDANIGWDALTTLQFVALAVLVEMLLGLGLALLLSRKLAETNLVTALFILPLGVAPVVSALVFRVLLDPAYGWVDYYLQTWGLIDQPIDWFGEPAYAWVAVIALDVWQWTPFVALILLAGLQGVPSEPKEAARLDGANADAAVLAHRAAVHDAVPGHRARVPHHRGVQDVRQHLRADRWRPGHLDLA